MPTKRNIQIPLVGMAPTAALIVSRGKINGPKIIVARESTLYYEYIVHGYGYGYILGPSPVPPIYLRW